MIKGKPFVKCACGKKSVIDKLVMYSKVKKNLTLIMNYLEMKEICFLN